MEKFDLVEHLKRQKEWSEKTFGPGIRTEGLIAKVNLIEIKVEK